jgi:hypothetical protein
VGNNSIVCAERVRITSEERKFENGSGPRPLQVLYSEP